MRSFQFSYNTSANTSARRRGAPFVVAVVGAVVVALLAALPVAARAQATLSTQGFGFPPGQFSSRTWGTAGAIAELDPLSPINPASIALQTTRVLTFQIEPEYRTVNTPSGSEHTNVARYPNVSATFPVGKRFVVSAGASTLLDRTSTTIFATNQVLAGVDTVPMNTTFRIDGAMSDLRLAAAWAVKPWLRFGAGLHGIVGHNLISITQAFDDTTTFDPFTETATLGFSGIAGSAGMQVTTKKVSLGLAGRLGGNLRASVGDTLLSRAKVPDHFGVSLAYTGIANSAIAIRTARDSWSRLDGLGTTTATGVDAWDTSIGGDFAGPSVGGHPLFLRTGFRTRTLPFQAEGHDVAERSVTGGLGTAFAAGRVLADFATIYARRTADASLTERAWTLSFGISIRP